MGWYGLSDSEHEIMKYIWKHEEVTLREGGSLAGEQRLYVEAADCLYASEPPDR